MEFQTYLWIKWLHYAAFISWMAMLFYLPRLFVYHAEHIADKGFCDVVNSDDTHYLFWAIYLTWRQTRINQARLFSHQTTLRRAFGAISF